MDILQYKKFCVGNNIFLLWVCWGNVFLWIGESCVRDSMSDVSVGFLSWYISVGFDILMEVVYMQLGLGLLYSL